MTSAPQTCACPLNDYAVCVAVNHDTYKAVALRLFENHEQQSPDDENSYKKYFVQSQDRGRGKNYPMPTYTIIQSL